MEQPDSMDTEMAEHTTPNSIFAHAPMPDVPNDAQKQIGYISGEDKTMRTLLMAGKRGQLANPTADREQLLGQLASLLEWLDNDGVELSAEVKRKANIEKALEQLSNPVMQLPEAYASKASQIRAKWDNEKRRLQVERAQAVNGDADGEDGGDPETKRPKASASKRKNSGNDTEPSKGRLREPPSNHPIWGVDGIMHGLTTKEGSRAPVLDPRYEKRDAKVYGANGLEVGDWFPRQLSALFWGAHGSSQGGISGNQVSGAYSIVVSGLYEALDKDLGETLYYSGSNSHDNRDRNEPPPRTAGTLSLHASIETENPVRVLRAASTKKTSHCPTEGLRYDGLYQVVAVGAGKNEHGGKTEQFKLVRLDGQEQINKFRPNSRESRDFDRIKDGFRER